jgi:GDPmannose 4,6-dehydratase
VDLLLGDPAKARRILGWQPRVGFEQLVALMVDEDLEELGRQQGQSPAGHRLAA